VAGDVVAGGALLLGRADHDVDLGRIDPRAVDHRE
jgi:hypothetical protein